LTDIIDSTVAAARIGKKKQKIIDLGNTFCTNMHKRGGGVTDVRCRTLAPDMMVVELLINV